MAKGAWQFHHVLLVLTAAFWSFVSSSEAALSVNKCLGDGDPQRIDFCTDALQIKELNCVDVAIAYHFRGLAHIESSHLEAALDDLNKSLYFNNFYASAYKTRGELYKQLGLRQLGDKDLSSASRLISEAEAAYTSSYWDKYMNSEYDQAISLANDAIARDPARGHAYQVRGDAYYQNEHYRWAIINFEMALKLVPSKDTWFKDIEGHLKYSRKNLKYEKALEPPTWFKPCDLPVPTTNSQTVEANPNTDDDRIDIQSTTFKATEAAVPVPAKRRVALVIGNSSYQFFGQLKNPENDARDIAEILSVIGFDVQTAFNADRITMEQHIDRFSREVEDAEAAVVYYAGHGMQYEGLNYLIPIDGKLEYETDFRKFIKVDDLVRDLKKTSGAQILILDSCRDSSAIQALLDGKLKTRTLLSGTGMAHQEASGMMIAFAAQSGKTAEDGEGENSPFALALKNNIGAVEVDARTVFARVRKDVYEATNRLQMPELSDSMIDDFYFNPLKK